ncbi:MAG: HlyD family efflux transporter periplasmic adaptor subunit [Planctomycetota bacterium]
MSSTARPFLVKKLTARQIFIGIGVLLIMTAGYLAATGQIPAFPTANNVEAAIEEAPPLPVNLATVQAVSFIDQTRTYTGMVRPRQQSELAFELTGKIASILVDEGTSIEEGAVIAQLDTDQLDAQRDAIKAQLAQANSVLEELNAGPRIERIRSAQASVQAAESEYENAQLKLARRATLRDQNVIPVEEYDQAAFEVRTRRAALDVAKERFEELKSGTRSEKVAAQLAAVHALDASLKEIDVAIAKSTLRAPFTATVTRRYVDPGSIAQPSRAVVKLVEEDHLEAWIGLPVDVAADIDLGSAVYLNVEGKQISATTSTRISEIDPVTRTQTVIFKIDDAETKNVIAGQLCKTRITSRIESSGVWIPNSALNKGVRGLWSVMTVVPDELGTLRAQKRDIEIIKTDTERVLAQGTIAEGDRIVIDGLHRITNGQAVADASSPAPTNVDSNSRTERSDAETEQSEGQQ